MATNFKSIFGDRLKFNPLLGLGLILFLGIPRFILVLQANASGNYRYTSMVFIFMMMLPFFLLNKNGRREIGIVKTKKIASLVYSFIIGIALCFPISLLGYLLYDYTDSNWFVYISNSYQAILPEDLSDQRFRYFVIFAIISMIFSPIGEEFMYRGFIHRCFEGRFGPKRASYIDSTAFAITHLAHFGILYTAAGWDFRPIPAIFWMLSMFCISRVFYSFRSRADSILGAIFSHAGFNLAMIFYIFYFIL